MSAKLVMATVLVAAMQLVGIADADAPIAKPNCPDLCGDVKIPFPFGIGVGCFSDHWYEIECKKNTTPYLANFSNIEVMKISLDYSLYGPQLLVGIPPLQACLKETATSINFTGSPFMFSTHSNVLMVEGCPGNAVLRDQSKNIMAGCGTVCGSSNTPPLLRNSCSGVECCQTVLPDTFNETGHSPFYHIDVYPQRQVRNVSQDCLTATLISSDSADQYAGNLSGSAVAPVVLVWTYDGLESNLSPSAYCPSTYVPCYCTHGLYGNPYVSNGCQVPEKCKKCPALCYPSYDHRTNKEIDNSYYCGLGPSKRPAVLGLSISFGVVALVIGLYGLYRFIKRRREIKGRAKFFKRNGGMLLHQQLASNEGIVEGTVVFTASELDKATDHFNENWILGQGGQGTVYKGMLVDGRIVAIKKAKLLDESQLEQFINEVVILSQINHRNVVKLIGCCLETEVPLLVYEYVPNGTLFQHIHDPDEDFSIGWEQRLKIALDLACAIAYLHSSSSIPIYHRC